MRVAFIGLGQMGRRMVRRLPADTTMVWNRSEEVLREVANAGYRAMASVEEGVRAAEVIITILTDHHAVREVGDRGLFRGLRTGHLWIDMTTGSPEAGESFQALAISEGATFVAAPVLGTLGPAAQGTLTVLSGGHVADVVTAEETLQHFGKLRRVGSVRQALAMKLIVNAVLAYYMEAVSETMVFGEAEGLERRFILDVLGESSVAAPVLQGKRERWQMGDYGHAEFPIPLLAKDLGLLVAEATEHHIRLPGITGLKDLFDIASADGAGETSDMAGIGEILAQRMI